MIALARDFPDAQPLLRRALNQAARELLLAQASDGPSS
jgi:1,4-alpha-glucan branching enzyme